MTTAPADIRNVAIIGHKGAGKTSLAEAMLFVATATPKLGKVADRSSSLDETIEEKEHQCSLEASVAKPARVCPAIAVRARSALRRRGSA